MRAFEDGTVRYNASIAIDASTYGDVTTAVAVGATRNEEIEILDKIHTASCESHVEFIPFKSKSTHFSKEDDREFFDGVIHSGSRWIRGLHFRHHSASRNQHYVEAVLGSMLFKDILEDMSEAESVFVLIDGDVGKVKTFAKSCGGLGIDSPVLANCYKSEWYYPHSLLADLSAGYLSWRIDNGIYDYSDPLIRAPQADVTRQEEWGLAFDFLQRKRNLPSYSHLQLSSTRADKEADRARVWYNGMVASGEAEPLPTTSLNRIATEIAELGYKNLSERVFSL